VSKAGDLTKRLVIGRALRSDRLGETLLPKKIALPVFASDALSSVAYAPDEIFLTLSIAGLAAYSFSWQIGLAVVVVMMTVVASYRQNVHAYPSGGGDYEVATVNLGPKWGLTVAAALLVDYTLTVAVSISSGVQNASSAIPSVEGHEVSLAIGLIALLTALNLRGVRESGGAFAIPTYGFMIAIIGMTVYGFIQKSTGDLALAESAQYTIAAEPGFEEGFMGLGAAFLLLRTFSSGCAALTGVEAISNGVPSFQKPKSKNAATTLLLMGGLAVVMLMGIIKLGDWTQLRFAEHPEEQLLLNGQPVGDSISQPTVISQLADAVYGGGVLAFITVAFTGVILVLAANTAFNGFPVLGSILARDGYLPRQLHTRGDRLAYSNGIVLLAAFAGILVVAYDAKVTSLIQLYIVGVFISFNLSQAGMIRHWNRHLKTETDPAVRGRMKRSRAINSFGLAMTAVVLIVVLVTKFTRGAWIALVAMGVLYVLMRGIRRHYDRVRAELAPADDELVAQPSRNHAIVLVSKIHSPTLRALAYARATRPHDLTALTVSVDPEDSQALQDEWDRRGLPVALTIIDSPYREITKPVLDYVRRIRLESPRDVVTVFIPEYVVGRWWEQLLHNQSALRLKSRLLFQPGVMVTSVPYQLKSSDLRKDDEERVAPGDSRKAVDPR